jgi:hypothetical protein
VGGGHRVVELIEECDVFFRAVLLREAEGLDAFDEHFGDVGLGFKHVDCFVCVVG